MEQYISLKVIQDKLMRDPLLSDITFETIIDYFIDFIRIVGCPMLFNDECKEITIKEYKGQLPNNFYQVNQIRYGECPMRASTDTFHTSDNKTIDNEYTFIIQGGMIHTSLKEGVIELSYKGIAMDELGYPLMTDNANVSRALENYIKCQYFTILFNSGKISIQVLQNVKQDYAWAVGSAETDLLRLDLSKAESFFNSYRTLLIRDHAFSSGFKNKGQKEILRRY